jgi:hypothetical protein
MPNALGAEQIVTVHESTVDPLEHSRGAIWLRRVPWLLLIAGSVLRLAWPRDMEWKFDEKWMFAKAQRVADGVDAWPWVGMPSGVGLENPGLSIWPFALLARAIHDPVVMTQAVQVLNVLALWGFALWVLSSWPNDDRELGLWGVALFAVSPLPVLFSRKIWAQDLLPILLLPWLWGHAKRELRGGAFAWGLFGALLGQLHMSGFFAAGALFVVTLLHDRGKFRWLPWLAGSACGALSLMPWLRFVLSDRARQSAAGGVLSLRFFSDALTNAWGLGLRYPLGRAYHAFLQGPQVAGIATHAAGLARYALLALLVFSGVMLVRERKKLTLSAPLRLYLWAMVLGGLLLSGMRVQVFAHYLIAWSPLVHVAAAWMLYRHRFALLALCGCQLLLSASFLLFIHQHGGAPDADYGVAYSHQSPEQRRALD